MIGAMCGKKIKRSAAGDFTDKQFWLPSNSTIGGSTMTRAGVRMGAMESIQVSANINCISTIARSMAAIPCNVWKTRPPGRGGGRDIATDYPTNHVLNGQANYELTSYQWMISRVLNRAVHGGTYDTIDRNSYSETTALWPSLTPNIQPMRLSNMQQLTEYDDVTVPGDLVYRVTKTFPEWRQDILPRTRILSIPGHTSLNGMIGIPSYNIMRQQLAVADALSKWEAGFFGKGFSPAYIATMDDPGVQLRKLALDSIKEQAAGWKADNQVLIAPFGMNLTQDEHRLDYAMLDQRNRDAYENICGYWGVPTILTGKTWGATYTNSEQYFLQYLKLCIFPWIVNDTQAFNAYLFNQAQRDAGYHADYDTSILEKMDGEAWSKRINAMWLAGSIKPDEIRDEAKMNPLEDGVGQKTYIQAQMKELGTEDAEQPAQPGKPALVIDNEAANG